MKKLMLFLGVLCSCSIPIAPGWTLKVGANTWDIVPREPDRRAMDDITALYAPIRQEIASRRAHFVEQAPGVSCFKGKLLWQRDTWVQYIGGDDAAPKVVYSGCGPDGCGPDEGNEYWIGRCLDEETWVEATTRFPDCFKTQAPLPLHCSPDKLLSWVKTERGWKTACLTAALLIPMKEGATACSADSLLVLTPTKQEEPLDTTIFPLSLPSTTRTSSCLPQSASRALPAPHTAKYYVLH